MPYPLSCGTWENICSRTVWRSFFRSQCR
ncbi:MAG: hypothetical protein HON65_01465 [Rhodospirillales bacterium]|nr:hypothetical protein [Rhodospirillales bacterium]